MPVDGWPTIAPISNSRSKRAEVAKRGSSSFGPLSWPQGLRTGVPETTTEDARPLYPMGIESQLTGSAFSGPRNIVPTFIAWFLPA